MPRIVALQFVAVYKTDVRPDTFEQLRQLSNVILPVPVGVEDEILRGCGEAAA